MNIYSALLLLSCYIDDDDDWRDVSGDVFDDGDNNNNKLY